MQFQHDTNPYAPPTVHDEPSRFPPEGGESQILAQPGTRWVARFIDGLLGMAVAIPIFVLLVVTDVVTVDDLQRNNFLGSALYIGASLPIGLYQWSLIARTGQSLGKKWQRIRIVKVDGSPVNFTSGVILREWITTLIGFVPFIGGLVGTVGLLMIFGRERRCLHDHIAGTKVVQLLR
ncbi:MAG: RDD family protein [Polyangiaceae bacterium]